MKSIILVIIALRDPLIFNLYNRVAIEPEFRKNNNYDFEEVNKEVVEVFRFRQLKTSIFLEI